MNKVNLVGRLTRNPDTRSTDGGLSVSKFSLAVDRRFKASGQPDVDFFNIVAFGKTAEFTERYFHKGMRMGLSGRLQTGNYTNKEGQKVYTTDVIAEEIEFVESKSGGDSQANSRPTPDKADADGFVNVPGNIDDDEMPFN